MMILNYESKKELKTKIGEELNYTETTFFEPEYKSTGTFAGCNRPHPIRSGSCDVEICRSQWMGKQFLPG